MTIVTDRKLTMVFTVQKTRNDIDSRVPDDQACVQLTLGFEFDGLKAVTMRVYGLARKIGSVIRRNVVDQKNAFRLFDLFQITEAVFAVSCKIYPLLILVPLD